MRQGGASLCSLDAEQKALRTHLLEVRTQLLLRKRAQPLAEAGCWQIGPSHKHSGSGITPCFHSPLALSTSCPNNQVCLPSKTKWPHCNARCLASARLKKLRLGICELPCGKPALDPLDPGGFVHPLAIALPSPRPWTCTRGCSTAAPCTLAAAVLILCCSRATSCPGGSLPLENLPREQGDMQGLTVPSLLLPAHRVCALPGSCVGHKSKRPPKQKSIDKNRLLQLWGKTH